MGNSSLTHGEIVKTGKIMCSVLALESCVLVSSPAMKELMYLYIQTCWSLVEGCSLQGHLISQRFWHIWGRSPQAKRCRYWQLGVSWNTLECQTSASGEARKTTETSLVPLTEVERHQGWRQVVLPQRSNCSLRSEARGAATLEPWCTGRSKLLSQDHEWCLIENC